MDNPAVDCGTQHFARSNTRERCRVRHASEKFLKRCEGAGSTARPIAAVPMAARLILIVALVAQIAWQAAAPKPAAAASELSRPLDSSVLRVLSFGEPIA